MARRQTESNVPVIPLCDKHGDMLSKQEFRWIFGVVMGLVLTICSLLAGCVSNNVASADRVEAQGVELMRQERARTSMRAELRSDIQRLQQEVQDSRRELTDKMDKLRDIMESRRAE